ncbi:MAG: 3-keto-disaccharide hydrolase [Chitinophagaceae bacterium]
MTTRLFITWFLFYILCVPVCWSQKNNQLTEKEKQEGFELLFNGRNLKGWRGYKLDHITTNWSVKNGAMIADGSTGDIVTVREYEDFELTLEYKISEGGNSGVFFHVQEGKEFMQVWHTGIEMQVMDNKKNPSGTDPLTGASSLYAMYAPVKDATKPAGKWNKVIIKVQNARVEYWLNDERVNQYTLWTAKWYEDREKCIHNKSRKPNWGEYRKGHIALQDEGFKVSYRNIKIRSLD